MNAFAAAQTLASSSRVVAPSINDHRLRHVSPSSSSGIPKAAPSSPSFFQLYDTSKQQSQSSSTSMETKTASHQSSNLFDEVTTLIGKTASTLVSVSFFILLAHRRDALILTLFIGSILNAIFSKVAKKVLNHDRPAELQSLANIKLKPSDGGMPSSHAMSLGFIGTSILGGVVPMEFRGMVGLAMVAYSGLALRYRVRDHLHTIDQVAVGLVLGVGNALLWLKFGVGSSNEIAGPVLAWVRVNCVSAETGLFPYLALSIPIVVGILVVGSFERRIALWLKNKESKQD